MNAATNETRLNIVLCPPAPSPQPLALTDIARGRLLPPQYFVSCSWISRPSGSVKYSSGVPSFAPPRFSIRMLM